MAKEVKRLTVEEAREAVKDSPPGRFIFDGPPTFVDGRKDVCVLSRICQFGGKRNADDFDFMYLVCRDKDGNIRVREVDHYILDKTTRWVRLGRAIEKNGIIKIQASVKGEPYPVQPVLLTEMNLAPQNSAR